MRAFVIDGPMSGGVQNVPEPQPAPGEVLVDVETVGLCGTDVELFAGTMPYLEHGLTTYPLRPGHEWVGTVRDIGVGVTSVHRGDRVTADTFIGCGNCALCDADRHHLCASHEEIGVRGNRPGALAERITLPATAIHTIPNQIPAAVGALVEPSSCALRALRSAGVGPGMRVLIWGTGTLGLLAAQFADALGATACVVGKVATQRQLATQLAVHDVRAPHQLGTDLFDCSIDATGARDVPAHALSHTAPGGCLALLGVAPDMAVLDTRLLVLNDITVIGVLGGSAVIDDTIELLASSNLDLSPLIAATIDLHEVAHVLRGCGRIGSTAAPKVHVRPT